MATSTKSARAVSKRASVKGAWVAFPHDDKAFRYPGAALQKHWERLHLGDKEPYPSAEYLAKLCKRNEALQQWVAESGMSYNELSENLAEAWRAFHRGAFEEAVQRAAELGALGYCVANKATVIYANYLEPNATKRLKLFEQAMQRAEEARQALPEHANSHYLYAYALGRYSQGISILQALAQGFAGKVKDALERTLKLEPRHAEAHIALGTYHTEVINQVGSLIGGLTYGASKDAVIKHYREALRLHPQSAIARVEYAWALAKLFGSDKAKEAKRLHAEACKLEAKDAMECLDVELARSRGEDEA